MTELPLVDVMLRTESTYFPDPNVEMNTVYVSIHEHRIEMYVETTKRKAKNYLAFLRSEGLFQPWNKNRPKLLKLLKKSGKANPEFTNRFSGVIAEESALRQYIEAHFEHIFVVEQRSDVIEWPYEQLELQGQLSA
ncbi:hypothetical protein [Paenibacillus taichungensis]